MCKNTELISHKRVASYI